MDAKRATAQPPIKPPPGSHAGFGSAVQVAGFPEREIAKDATQRGEVITCRGRKPRADAEGHANAEPPFTLPNMRFRIRVGSPEGNFFPTARAATGRVSDDPCRTGDGRW